MRLRISLVRFAISILLPTVTTVTLAADITGAGATFPYPIYAKWADAYNKATGIRLNYQSIGSGGGIKQIKAKTIDFGASDKPLPLQELHKNDLTQFPTVIGAVVPVVNVDNIQAGQIKLTGNVLADIFLGKIKQWNDAAIASLNPGVDLPSSAIAVVHRADGSGTTFLFTDYLSKVSPEWNAKIGADVSVAWPVGTGGKGNEGVANFVRQIKNSIGYVEAAYVKQSKMNYVLLQNHDGAYVIPAEDSIKAAAENTQWDAASGFYEILTHKPGPDSWPITGATFVLMQKSQDNPLHAQEVLKFFEWAYKRGGNMALELDYIPLPDNVVKLIVDSWQENIKDKNGRAIYTAR
ncbi:MAG: phosphate ABC transporter substrate-binding protein PstS [Nitrosomonas sp. PRO4]|nr:phosphate ABC transporter substrate-binding protein PstS [Nitrosomonas sp. PRO4]